MRRPHPLPWTVRELLALLSKDHLLELLTAVAGDESLATVAGRLHIPVADVHHRLRTLCMYGLVCYDRRRPGRYRLSEAVSPVHEPRGTRLLLTTTTGEYIALLLRHR